MISSNQNSSKGTWTTSLFEKLYLNVSSCPTVLMDDFMVAMVHKKTKHEYYQAPEEYDESATILAVDLRDNSVEEHTMHDFASHKEYSFTKYKNNQIIKFGGRRKGKVLKDIIWIKIKSFRPFHVICEEIEILDNDRDEDEDERDSYETSSEESTGQKDYENIPALFRQTAQIYKNHLDVYGGRKRDFDLGPQSDLWKFNLKKETWKLCKPKGQDPGPREYAKSFIFEDKMYIYGGEGRSEARENNIFMLDFKVNTWIQIHQQTSIGKQIDLGEIQTNGDLYKGNLLVLGGQENGLYCWNLKSNSWSTFEIEKIEDPQSHLIVYKDLVVINKRTENRLSMAILNLDNLEIPTEETPEQKRRRELFMSEEESDVKLKVQDKLIPAHKQVLIEKSKYFANLFNSGMVESRQEIIDIQDCEYDVFQEFLRYLYCKEMKLNADMAIKLSYLSDKYLQKDLNDKCMNFFQHNLTSKNIYTVFDFAQKENISELVNWCLKFFENNVNIDNVAELIEYLYNKPDDEFETELRKIRKQAFEIVCDNFIVASKTQAEKLEFYEEFLIRNIQMDTFASLANFISAQIQNKKKFENMISNLRTRVFDFAHQNFDTLQKNNIFKYTHKNFFIEVFSYEISKQKIAKEKMNIEDDNEAESQSKKGLKRKEPSHNDGTLEENPALKQKKKG